MLLTGQSDVLRINANVSQHHKNAMKLTQNAQRFTSQIVTKTHNELTENVNAQRERSIKPPRKNTRLQFINLPVPDHA